MKSKVMRIFVAITVLSAGILPGATASRARLALKKIVGAPAEAPGATAPEAEGGRRQLGLQALRAGVHQVHENL